MVDYASMNPQEIIQLLQSNPQYQQIDPNLDPDSYSYGLSPWGAAIQPTGGPNMDEGMFGTGTDPGFLVDLTPAFDAAGEGGKYGKYVGKYDASGKLINVGFQPHERSGGWVAENIEWVGPLVVAAAGAIGGGAFAGGGELFGGADSGSMFGGTGADALGAAEPLAGEFAFLDPTPFAGLEQAGMGTAAGATAGAGAVPTVAGALPSGLVPAAQVAGAGASVAGALGGSDGPVSPDPQIDAGIDDRTLDQILNDTGTSIDNDPYPGADYTTEGFNNVLTENPNLPSWVKDILKAGGSAAKSLLDSGLLGNLVTAGVDFAAANNIANRMFGLGDQIKADYAPALEYAKTKGEFKPFAMRSPFSSTDNAGNADVDQVYKDILSKSNPVAEQSFAAAGNFDYNQNAQEEFDLMMQILGPEFEKEQLATESRMRSQGRLGLSNAPELTALEKAQADQRLKAMLQARTTGLARRGTLIGQGTAAMAPSLSVWQELQKQQQLANQTGAQAGQIGNQALSTWANLFSNAQTQSMQPKVYGAGIVSDAITAAARPVGQAAGTAVNRAWDWLSK